MRLTARERSARCAGREPQCVYSAFRREPASEPASEPPSDAEQDVQDDAKEDTAHQPGPSSRRGADAPAKRSAAAPQTQPEVPSGGKRPRSNKQRKS